MDITKKCEICGESYKMLKLGIIDLETANCDCESKKYNDEVRASKIEVFLKNCKIPKKYINDKLKDWVEVGDNIQLMEVSKKYINEIVPNLEKGRGILFAGSVGTGKTRMLSFLLKRIIKTMAVEGIFISYDDFSSHLAFDSSSESINKYISKLKTVEILFVDDFGESEIYKHKRNHLTNLINYRYYNGKTTLFTTMKTIDELSKMVGEHIVSRVLEMCEDNIVELINTPDMRKPANRVKYLSSNES